MNHPLTTFWERAYASYATGAHSYYVENLPDPIISAHFGVTNIIQGLDQAIEVPETKHLRNNFFLGSFRVREIDFDFREGKTVSLLSARQENFFWDLMEDGFKETVSFLKSLMEFLPSLSADFYVSYLMEKDKPFAAAVIGIAGDHALLLSTVIKSSHRDQKKSRSLEALIHSVLRAKHVEHCVFWTKSEKLLNYADHVDRYLIYTNKGGNK